MSLRRRAMLKSTAGVVFGTGIASHSVAASHSGLDRSIRVEQGRYLKKHAAQRQSIYDMMIPIFDPPDNADYAAKFAESLAPSVSSLLPGIVGSAAELNETLKWYNDILESNEFRAVSQQGILVFAEDPKGGDGSAMDSAKEELEKLKEAANSVEKAASSYRQTPDTEKKKALVEALQQEQQRTENIDWINAWSDISVDQYRSLFGGDAEDAARLVRDNAGAASQIISAAGEVIQSQVDILNRGGLSRVTDLVVTYQDQIDQARQNVPSAIFSMYAGDSLNIRIQNEDEEDLTVTWINTNSDGDVQDYKLTEQSANADLMIPEATVKEIRESENPTTEISKAWNNNEISLKGDGFVNGIKYNHTELISDIFNAVSTI